MTIEQYEDHARRLRTGMLNIAQRFLGNREQAEDAVQEVLMRLWLLRDKVDGTDGVEPLLARMTRNHCVDLWRRHQQETAARQAIARHQSPVTYMDTTPTERHELLQTARRHLTPAEQRLFHMRQDLNMEVSQIAATTGMQPRSVSAIVSTARRKIYDELKKKGAL